MKKRLLVSLLFITLFSAASLYVLILAQGYRFENNGQVITTSIIRINSIPEDVTVYINDQNVDKKENRIENLDPGVAKVTLKKDGYKSWERIVTLRPGIVEDIFAQLYPERLQFERLTNKNVDQFYLSKNSEYTFYTILKSEIPSDLGIWRLKLNRSLLDFNQNTPEKVFDFPDDIKTLLTNYAILISPDNSKAFLNLIDTKALYLIDFNNKRISSINELIGFYPEKISWFEGSNSSVFATSQLVTSFDIATNQLNLIYFSSPNQPIFSVGANAVYYYRKDLNKIFKYQNKTNTLLENNEFSLTLSDEITNISISEDSDSIFFIDTNSNHYFVDLDRKYLGKSDKQGSLIQVSPNGKNYIERLSNNLMRASYFEENLDKKTYSYFTQEFSVQDGLEFLNYTKNSQNIVFVMNKDSNREIWLSDFDGLNLLPVVQNEVIANEKVLISNNSTDLFVLLEDSSSSIDNSKVNNIYKFKLTLD